MKLWIPRPEILPLQHPQYPWYLGSPDALIDPLNTTLGGIVSTGGVDFKTTGRRHDYGEPPDGVPDWVATQCHWYMGLTDAKWWDVAVLFFAPRREFAIYHLERNQEIIDNLIEAGKNFWENHVVPQIPPPIDASPSSAKYLRITYPKDAQDYLDADAKLEELIHLYKESKATLEYHQKLHDLDKHKLQAAIGDHAGVRSSYGRVDWKKNRDRTETDWLAIATGLTLELAGALNNPEAALTVKKNYIEKHTTIKPGARVFRTYFKEDV